MRRMTIIAKVPDILLAVNDFSSVLLDVVFCLREAVMSVCGFVIASEGLIVAMYGKVRAVKSNHLSHPSGK
jgi:hypothetical protein